MRYYLIIVLVLAVGAYSCQKDDSKQPYGISKIYMPQAIQQSGGRRAPGELTAVIGRLHAMLGYTTIGEILSGDPAAFLHTIREQCVQIHELTYRYYVQYSIQSALAV